LIDSTAIVHSDAGIGDDVSIGAYAVIGAGVEIGNGCSIASHVVINGPTRIGKNNKIFQFCSIGDDPQDKKYHGEAKSTLEIGDGNVIREYCSINRGTVGGGGVTRLGDNNWIMAYVHIAHDCLIGNNITFANNTTLAGHVIIDDYVILGGFTGVHQFCRIGSYSLTAISSVVVKDVPPFLIVSGNTAKPSGLNKEGLKRHGFTKDAVSSLLQAYKVIYRKGYLLKDALIKLKSSAKESTEVADFVSFIEQSDRGIIR